MSVLALPHAVNVLKCVSLHPAPIEGRDRFMRHRTWDLCVTSRRATAVPDSRKGGGTIARPAPPSLRRRSGVPDRRRGIAKALQRIQRSAKRWQPGGDVPPSHRERRLRGPAADRALRTWPRCPFRGLSPVPPGAGQAASSFSLTKLTLCRPRGFRFVPHPDPTGRTSSFRRDSTREPPARRRPRPRVLSRAPPGGTCSSTSTLRRSIWMCPVALCVWPEFSCLSVAGLAASGLVDQTENGTPKKKGTHERNRALATGSPCKPYVR